MVGSQSKNEHILDLARELLDDIELSRLNPESLLLKASRLARWVGSDEIRLWLEFEMRGYNSKEPISLKYITRTGRWINYEKKTAWFGPLAQQDALIEAERAKLSVMRIPDTGGDYAASAIASVTMAMTACTNMISTLSGVRSRVLALLHQFVTQVYYERQFDNLAESIFDAHRDSIDNLIAENCGDVLQKIPAVMSRLSERDEESISQALSTCRRIIEAFADAVYPPTDETIELGGNTLKLDASKHQNRINALIAKHTDSQSRRIRLRQNLANLFDRVSTGVHADVTAEEARSLFLNTYLFLGEVLHLSNPSAQPPTSAETER